MMFPNDDPALVEFLRHHHPSVPPADPHLEDRILAAVEECGVGSIAPPPVQRRRYRPWMMSGAIAAGLVATVVGYQSLQPKQPNEADLVQLEAFIEANWQSATVEETNDTDLIFTELPVE